MGGEGRGGEHELVKSAEFSLVGFGNTVLIPRISLGLSVVKFRCCQFPV